MGRRDIQADYRAAYIEQYESYKAAGRHRRAAQVAAILREQFGHDVEPAPERADVKQPENAARPRPRNRKENRNA